MSKELCQSIVKILDDKKAIDIVAIEISELTIVADYFVIATATSSTHLKSLSDEVEFRMAEKGAVMRSIEGKATGWILMDFGVVVLHLFTNETRKYYNLERLWEDGSFLDISGFVKE
ncbi:MAG: Ribosomal silencing factor RsfS [Firmicutes bacterium ADurb.Bin300]|jgi:ribosome-associated protein|nr:MAG: Ribosomal silencing factor RsfS [Firmicutes bacterium ADurb.Bin300]HOD02549.1 ribosome silencing factor [Clostridiales bacterium]